jgi:hypothetical protein
VHVLQWQIQSTTPSKNYENDKKSLLVAMSGTPAVQSSIPDKILFSIPYWKLAVPG